MLTINLVADMVVYKIHYPILCSVKMYGVWYIYMNLQKTVSLWHYVDIEILPNNQCN